MSRYPTSGTDPAHDIFRYERQPLDAIFAPESVAVVGASDTPGSVGNTLMRNLLENSFGGLVFPVNPKRKSIMGVRAYPSVGQIPEHVDLAVIATPAATVPGVVDECVEAGVRGAVIISAGFKEIGEEGAELERQVLEKARRGGMRLIGPNCLGVTRPGRGLNATFAHAMAPTGSVGFISQSGALGTSILDWALQENVGFSYFISIGSMLDVGWGDLIYYLGDDSRVGSIVLYMESVGEVRTFLSAAREVAFTKPIIVIKAGRSEAAAQAAASHTGALTGSDRVLDSAFARSGVLRVNNIADLFYTAEVLSKQPRPKGSRLSIITNAGGPGVLATDVLVDGGGELAKLSDESMSELDEFLPEAWSHGNPVDVLGDAPPERYQKAVEVVRKDPGSDGALVVLTPQAMSDPTRTAEHLREEAQNGRKPILASWMGGSEISAGREVLNRAGIPTFSYPDTAARIFNYMWRYSTNLRSLYETPALAEATEAEHAAADEIVGYVRERGRTILTEAESKQLLADYGIPTVETRVAEDEGAAVEAAGEIGYPVVLKLNSETVTHKTDVGGVKLNLTDADDVRRAFEEIKGGVAAEDFHGVTVQPMISQDGYEVILGSNIDSQFGPVLLFGSGGSLVEVMEDTALGLPPLNTTLARRMMEETRIHRALKGVRGQQPVDVAELEQLLVRFSQLVVDQPWIKEIDINPLLASPERLLALDARVVLHDPDTPEEELPEPAIRPYPAQYIERTKLDDGQEITVRPIRPEDEPMMVRFHETLSEESVYMRYFRTIRLNQRTSHERLTRICFVDYDREMALVAERETPGSDEREILGVGRLSKVHGSEEAEFSLVVSDGMHGHGIGTEILSRLIEVGREEGLHHITADILNQNRAMQRVSQKLGFELRHDREEGLVKAAIDLRATVGAGTG